MGKLKLTDNALYILKQRYLLRDKDREVIETPRKLFRRVAKSIASIELNYGKTKQEAKQIEREFFKMLTNLDFLPNSPTLMNAGTDLGQLSACFVLPVEDDIDGIFKAVHYAAKIHKTGGGTGFSFSRLRPKNDVVKKTGGIASGPTSFMRVYDVATDVIRQGGKRRGANMGILRVDHPDIQDFIALKKGEGIKCPKCGKEIKTSLIIAFANFNLSVGITDKFMDAVKNDKYFDLINPRTKKVVQTMRARTIWSLLTYMSWNNGEPSMIFLDTINRTNPTPELGELEATNPCGETPLLPYESCNLGSINLSNFFRNRKNGDRIDWDRLGKTIRLAVRFLDDVIDANKYPLPEIKEATFKTRKIGLGVMGFADLLVKMEIKYDSKEAIRLAKRIMKFVQTEGRETSRELGKERGNFPCKEQSIYKNEEFMRNATITTVAPTGTISVIANCSQGIEPIFALAQQRNVKESLGKNLIEVNSTVKTFLESKGLWSPEVEKAIMGIEGSKCLVLPSAVKKVLVTAHDVSPEWHVRMQAAFQKYTDNAVSKTVNMTFNHTVEDVEKVFLLAHELGCKGTTIYRDGSRKNQLLENANGSCPTCV